MASSPSPDQSGAGSNDNEEEFNPPQISRTGASPSGSA